MATMMEFLRTVPFVISREATSKTFFASNSELKRMFERGSVEVNGEKAMPNDPWPFLGDRVVIHPKGKNRTTLL